MITRVALAVGTLVLAAGAAGCGATAPEPDQDLEPIGTVYGLPGEWGNIYQAEINGVPCMVYVGDRQGGISCDWDDNEGAQP